MRYPNPLPLPPYPPKLQRIPVSASRYADGPETQGNVSGDLAITFTNRLTRLNQLPVLVDAEGGIPLDLTQFHGVWTGETDSFAPGALPSLDALPLDDEDRFLLTPLSEALPAGVPSAASSAAPAVSQRKSGAADVTWLRRTEYLASSNGKSTPDRLTRDKPGRQDDILHVDTSREAAVARINETFAAVQDSGSLGNLRHPTKPHLRPVSSHEFLPDIDTWATNYQLVRFQDWPGRTRAGRPVPDPRVSEALLRPVNQGGDQRISLYLVAGSDHNSADTADTEPEQKEKAAREGADSDDEGLFGGSESEDEGKPKQQKPSPPESSGNAQSQEKLDDLAASQLAQRRLKGEVVALDEIVDGLAPESSGSEFRFHRDYQAGENDSHASNNRFVITLTQEGEQVAPPSSKAPSEWQSRQLAQKGISPPIVGSGKRRAVAYYHPVAMQYTLRQKRMKRNESARYQDMWASVHASDRALFDWEIKRLWRSRRQVDQLDPTLEGEVLESDVEEEAEDASMASAPHSQHEPPVPQTHKDSDHETDEKESSSPRRHRAESSASPPPAPHLHGDAHGKQPSPEASDSGSNSGSDEDMEDAEPEEMDDELAALQAEAQGQDDEINTSSRRRRRPAAEADAAGMQATGDQDDDDDGDDE